MAQWSSFAIKVPGKDLLKPAKNALETLLVYLEIVKAVLETLKVFLIDFGNPVKVLVEALLKLVVSLLASLQRSGVYAYYDVPDPVADPNFSRHAGGYPAFARRFKQSLLDAQDVNRPQPIGGATKGGYVLIVVDADSPLALLALMKTLLRFFGQELLRPQFAAPANVRVVPLGAKGDRLLSVASVFADPPAALSVEWELPSTVNPPDAAFTGLASSVGAEFIPPKWLVERAEAPLNQEVPDSQIGDPAACGYVTKVVESPTIDFRTGQHVTHKIRVQDEYGAPFVKFQSYAIVSVASTPTIFLTGQTGTFRFIDAGVQKDKTYTYRVRAYSGTLVFEDKEVGLLAFNPAQIVANMNDGGSYRFEWLPKDLSKVVVMGRPSALVRGRVPTLPAQFNVLEAIRRVFLAALSLNFHLGLPLADPVLDGQGKPVLGPDGNPVLKPLFAQNGTPLPPLDAVTDVGRGSLAQLAGPVPTGFLPDSFLNVLVKAPITDAAGLLPLLPWQQKVVRFHAARLANRFGSLMLDLPGGLPEAFRALMQGALPAGVPAAAGLPGSTLAGQDTLEKLVYALTAVEMNQGTVGKVAGAVFETTVFQAGEVTEATRKTYGSAYRDVVVRKNVLAAVTFLLNMNGQGVPPDWHQIAVLRDMIPWSGQLIYELLAKIQALLDAYKGLLDEVKAFIDLIVRKIDKLEQFLQYLISILNFIESLDVGFYVLSSGTLGGDVTEWTTTLDQAGGTTPPSGPGGYTAGIGFAYLAPDIGAFTTAFGLIFLCRPRGVSFAFKGTLNQSLFNRFLAFAQAQLPDVAARLNHLATEQQRLGILSFSYDSNGLPLSYTPQPSSSYLGRLLAAYEVLGGDAFYDLNIRSMSQAVFLIRADETRPAQLMSNGEVVGTPGLGDRATAELMEPARHWMEDVLFARREYLERKIRRCIDYGDQLQAEQDELLRVVAAADQEGSLGYILAEIQALISDPTYRPAYDDRGTDPHGKLTGAPLLPYSAGPDRTPGDVYGKDSGDQGVVKPGEKP